MRIVPFIAHGLLTLSALGLGCVQEKTARPVADDGGSSTPAPPAPVPDACYSKDLGREACYDGHPAFPECLEELWDLPGCRSQNDRSPGCRDEICEVDCGGDRCAGLPTCGGCDGTLCSIYDNYFVCRGGQWVEVLDTGGHEDFSTWRYPDMEMDAWIPDARVDAAEGGTDGGLPDGGARDGGRADAGDQGPGDRAPP